MTYLKIAWRNLIKRKRNTLVLLLAIGVGMFALLFFQATIEGFYKALINTVVDYKLGHMQIHQKEYRLKKDAKFVIPNPEKVEDAVKTAPHVVGYSPRVLCQGMARSAESSNFATIYGIEPEKERKVTILLNEIVKGEPVMPDDRRGILIGRALSEKLEVGVGDKVVIMLRNIDGEMTGAALRVRGIFKGQSNEMEKTQVYVSIKKARELVGLDKNALHEIAIRLDDARNIPPVKSYLTGRLNDKKLSIEGWGELQPVIKQQVELSWVSSMILFIIVFVALAFGIVNSFMMEIFERFREFGIMMALGTRPINIFLTLIYESVFLGIIGSAMGVLFSFLILRVAMGGYMDLTHFASGLEYFGISPMVPMPLTWITIGWCSAGILLTSVLATVYPAIRAAFFKPVEAIRYV